MTEDEFREALDNLVKTVRIFAKCPKCFIPLSHKEYVKLKCGTCGTIDFEQIVFEQNKGAGRA